MKSKGYLLVEEQASRRHAVLAVKQLQDESAIRSRVRVGKVLSTMRCLLWGLDSTTFFFQKSCFMTKQRTIDEILGNLPPNQKETIQNLRVLIKNSTTETIELVKNRKIT
jgi:hypothetical protein